MVEEPPQEKTHIAGWHKKVGQTIGASGAAGDDLREVECTATGFQAGDEVRVLPYRVDNDTQYNTLVDQDHSSVQSTHVLLTPYNFQPWG